MEITEKQLADIISTSIMSVMDKHPCGMESSAKYLSDKVYFITHNIDLAIHAENCVITALTSNEF